ncbi:MAG TPA: N-acetylglucosamine-6-phosphate deacetylase [Pyrinomonadaceae bacterium]|nr:N-acetylglucosamine-6-phosphate deacetylase [Acidobacteriota bacterium]HQZ96805.1 N-acetylglucosamine-6-phosphate deacetylase [Pyrinomonadaceae bacterium]
MSSKRLRIDGQDIEVANGHFVAANGNARLALIETSGLTVIPGFIDVHNHGAVGIDVNEADVDGLLQVAAFLATRGVTAWMPTLVPDSDENYRRVIGAIDELMIVQEGKPVAQVVGVHYEGVFANEKMCGALRPEYFKSGQRAPTTPSAEAAATPPQAGGEFLGLPKLKSGVHMTTLAPEIDGGIELIEALVGDGWIVSIGHTRAGHETLDRAYAAGVRHITHFFNAMTGVHHREVGVAGWGLANEGVTFDIIADGIHVHPDMLRVACRAKSPDKVSLISDSVAPTGLGDGEFQLWGETISVVNGRTRNERGSIAGSVIAMDDAVRTMLSVGFSANEVSQMSSTNPAKLLGLDNTRGTLDIGKRADLVALDQDGNVAFTMIGGEMVS